MNKIIYLFFVMFLFCSQVESPFTDPSNARMNIIDTGTSFSTDNTDSALIFTSETLTVASTVHELIDSFSVNTTCNRYWKSKTVLNPTSELYRFIVSFYDTGKQTITITTFRSNNDNQVQEITLKVLNPLYMNDIFNYNYADTITLSSSSVGDKDGTIYNWLFGNSGQLIQSPYSSIHTSITSADNTDNMGFLWVSDSAFVSPMVFFKYSFFDSTPPVIICVNDNYDKNTKTVTTSDTILSFMVRVTDRGNQSVGSVAINDEQPDFKRQNVYTSIIKNIYLHEKDNPMKIRVMAVDNNEFANDTTEFFYIVFDKNVVSSGATALKISSITDNSLITAQNNFYIFGTAENTKNQIMILSFFLNGNLISDTLINGFGNWNSLLTLNNGTNSFYILAKDTNGSTLDSESVTLFLNEITIDTTPPVIISTECDGQQITSQDIFYTQNDSVKIQITAFDEGSGIQKLVFNEDTIPVSVKNYKQTYIIHDILHMLNSIVIKVIDNKGNVSTDTLSIIRNSSPTYTMNNTIPYVVFIGNTYTDTIHFSDNDNDFIILHVLSKPSSMSIDSKGVITWTPQIEDTAEGFSFQLKDGFTATLSSYYNFAIVDSATMSPRITILDSTYIPQFIEAEKDSINSYIRIADGTGRPPFRFSASILNKSIQILDSSPDSLIHWIPSAENAGIAELQIIVEDSLRYSDTLYRSFEILPKNRNQSTLTWTSSIDTRMDSLLLLNYLKDTANIRFTIHDSDDPRTEKHRIYIKSNNINSSFIAQSDTFSVNLFSISNKFTDTLFVTVSDNTGTIDTAIIPLIYIYTPELISNLYSWHTDETIEYSFITPNKVKNWNGTGSHPIQFANPSFDIFASQAEINNHDAVELNDEDVYIYSDENGQIFDTALTMFFVAKYDSVSAKYGYQAIVTSSDYGSSVINRTTGFGFANDGTVSLFSRVSNNLKINAANSNLKLIQNQWHIVSFSTSGVSNSRMSLDVSVDRLHDTITDATAYVDNALFMGNGYIFTPIYPLLGSIAEVIIYNRVLSMEERTSIELYLKTKFNLSN